MAADPFIPLGAREAIRTISDYPPLIMLAAAESIARVAAERIPDRLDTTLHPAPHRVQLKRTKGMGGAAVDDDWYELDWQLAQFATPTRIGR